MYATIHTVQGAPGPEDRSWVDAVLTGLRARAVPAGALVAAPIGLGAGCVLALWDDEADAAGTAAGFATGPVTVGPGTGCQVTGRRAGASRGPAHFLQLVTFTGRSPDWCTAFDRAGDERIWPAVKDLPGMVESVVGGNAGGDRFTATLADSIETLESGAAAIMSTELLPWEDPANLTGPDTLLIQRLLHADLPVGATH